MDFKKYTIMLFLPYSKESARKQCKCHKCDITKKKIIYEKFVCLFTVMKKCYNFFKNVGYHFFRFV